MPDRNEAYSPAHALQRLVYAAGLQRRSQLRKFRHPSPLFPQWHVRDLGEPSDYGPASDGRTRQGPCVLLTP